jgi:hypothetical protein
MRRSRNWFAILAALIVLAAVGWWSWPVEWSFEDLFFPRLEIALTAAPATITVGENVHISKPHEKIAFTECIIAADPNRENRLFAASMYWPHADRQSLVGYLSDDGGATWSTSLELIADREKRECLNDPTAAFGPDSDLYVVHMRLDDAKRGPEWVGKEGAGSLDWLCLPSGATAWETRGRIDRFIDRPWLAIDHTKGPNRGRLYCSANISAGFFITSSDGGRTFQFPTVPYPPRWNAYPAQPVVLSDGSVVAAFRSSRDRGFVWQPQYMRTFLSGDGGQTLTAGAHVSNWKHAHLTPNMLTTEGPTFPQMAVDPGSRRFADNLYVVWAQRFDNRRSTEWILFSRSTDRGKTWSAPVNLSEQTEAEDPARDYLAYIPCVAVNRAGVVAVTWYDRRGLTPAAEGGAMTGWNVRMRVSLDGGATWAPSVQVTSQPSTGELTGGHTAGLTADAAGRFHPLWIDDRSGKPQLWTAAVRVEE